MATLVYPTFLTEIYEVWTDLSGILDCVWCCCCQNGRQYNATENKLNSIHFPVCIASVLVAPVPCIAAHIRRKVIAKYSIDEGMGASVCLGVFFWPLSLCQTNRELQLRDSSPGGTCYEPAASMT